jgi:RNA polymerase sigma factor (sigma-70 family)
MTRLSKTNAANPFAGSDDKEIITACLKGEESAWEALILRYQRLIYSIPLRSRLSQDDAADVFQAVCLKLYEKLETLRDHERLSAWIITTTTRECWRWSARQRRETSTDDFENGEESGAPKQIASDLPLADDERIALEQQHTVRQAVAALSERCRRLVTLLFYNKDEASYSDISRQMEMPVASIGPTRARCLEKLKKLLHGKI